MAKPWEEQRAAIEAADKLASSKIKYNPNKGYYWTNPDNINIYVSETEAMKLDPTGTGKAQWANTYEPAWNEYSADMQRQMQTAFDRSYADARGRLGYGLAMGGSGEGGLAEAARMQLTTEAQNKRMDIASQRDTMLQQAYIQFMTTKDAQAFELAKMAANYEYNRKIAEMNQPSFWDSLGSIVGMGAGIYFAPATGGLSLGLAGGAFGSTYGGSAQAGLENYA